jgi:hypothetical protein
MCILTFSTTFVWSISHSKNWARYDQKCVRLHIKYQLFLSDFNETLIFSADILKLLKYKISWKSVHLEAKLFQDDWLTRKLTVTFRNFANVPKQWNWVSNTETKNKSPAIDSIQAQLLKQGNQELIQPLQKLLLFI